MKFTKEELTVEYKGKPFCMISSSLAKQQKLTKESLEELKETHRERARIFGKMEATDNPDKLRALAIEFQTLEFKQQKIWGFPQNPDYHRWFEVPKCTCPKLDNLDRIPTKYRIYSGICPVHSIKPVVPKWKQIWRTIFKIKWK